ncbi:DUF4255 domain-containing protein [Photorhabdus temperata]|uniref:Pvc16 N-terminal domain-containing protein n=1 Tax=Photorhabdus temperata J3 TaxID=1389415 RepID=U7QX02_PHOTE|nr:hypothetical protein O185_19555 [Photorhabdus temperata J3]
MTNIINPDNAIIAVNNALNEILSQRLIISGQKIDIRFDLPEVNSIPSAPTVSIFLYDIHEDLQLRSTESRLYNPATSTLLPGWVNINYNYLITYWHSSNPGGGDNPDSKPDNQAAHVMTAILNALINNRQLPDISGAYTRVIPPQENLNSLGNFWQALGNRPRLSLLYSITAPVKLQNIEDAIKPISDIFTFVDQKSNLDNSQINQALANKLYADLGGTKEVRLALAKVNLTTKFTAENNEDKENKSVILEVSGMTSLAYLCKIENTLLTWMNSKKPVIEVNGTGIIISKVDLNLDSINKALKNKLCIDLGDTKEVHLALTKVNLATQFTTENNEDQENKNVILEVSGITTSIYLPKIKSVLSGWKSNQSAVVKVNGIGIIVYEENSNKLMGI